SSTGTTSGERPPESSASWAASSPRPPAAPERLLPGLPARGVVVLRVGGFLDESPFALFDLELSAAEGDARLTLEDASRPGVVRPGQLDDDGPHLGLLGVRPVEHLGRPQDRLAGAHPRALVSDLHEASPADDD